MAESEQIQLRELDIDMIAPSSKNYLDPHQGGSKLVVIGKPNTGKSTLISSILYEKRDLIPCGVAMSGTEDSNRFYQNIFPSTFVYESYEEEVVKSYVERQKLAKKYLQNPWGCIVIDDCSDKKIFSSKIQEVFYKNSRHWKSFSIVGLQYSLDVSPVIRNNIDGVFILREPIAENRKRIYNSYASIIPDYNIFCTLMNNVTEDHTALYIHNYSTTNKWEDCVFWYKSKSPAEMEGFKVGCKEFWDFHNSRFDPDYLNAI